jgi:toxin HigB-1
LIDDIIDICYYFAMIESFNDTETENIFHGVVSRKLPPDIQKTARRKLIYLYETETLQDLFASPGNRLEKLRGNRAGQYSIRINNRWRIFFKWRQGWAQEVEIVDYHE